LRPGVTAGSQRPPSSGEPGRSSPPRRPATAYSRRAMDALIETMQRWVVDYGYTAIFLLMLAESACIPFPSEVTMLVAGWYSATGDIDFFWAGAWGVMGNLVGSLIAYAVGYKTGRNLLDRYGKYVLIRSHDIDRAEVWWARYGEAATFISRLLPVIRTFISLPAGIARMPLGKFTIYTFLGVIPWTYALTYIGVVVEDNWERVLDYFDIPTLVIGALIVAGAVFWYVRKRRRRRETEFSQN
jgi:membrane protein DedA with SNARE-associated domain